MKNLPIQSENRMNITHPIIRGNQANVILNAAIVGGGKACLNLLQLLDKDRSSRLRIKIIGVSDINPDSPGFQYAKEMNLFTTTDYHKLFELDGLNLVIELTGAREIADEISGSRPSNVSVMDHVSTKLLWDLIQMEVEKNDLGREWERYIEMMRKQNKIIPDSLPYRIMVVNMDKTIETVNQTFLNSFNFTEDEVLGRHCYEIRHDKGRPCSIDGTGCYIDEQIEEIKKTGIFSTIQEYTTEAGENRFDVITLAPILDEEGEIFQVLEASRDVTDRIRLEREVQKSNTFFQNVIQSTVDGIVFLDTRGNVLIFNEGMARLTGFSAEEIINRGHVSLFYPIDIARQNMKIMRSDQHGPPGKLNPTSMNITTKDGSEIPVTISASIITINGEEVGSVGIFTDMREILEMRKNLEEAQIQLVQSEKIASVGRMAAGVAHEINNPLAGIMIYAELIKNNIQDNPQLLEDTQEIIDQTLRCKKIVSELLEFSRQSLGKLSSFSIKELIEKSLNLLINQAQFQDIRVSKKIQGDLPAMIGDMGQLQQVFTNLFINSADAMEGKGQLTIEASFDELKNQFIIKVKDNGPGIPKKVRDKIFDMFFTTKPVGKGTGLGLSISKNILQLHGGTITIDSKVKRGTTFYIELPLGFMEQPADEPVFIGLDE
ncbi:ATP-binding protein [Thermodesulfobacteriota bacterium]